MACGLQVGSKGGHMWHPAGCCKGSAKHRCRFHTARELTLAPEWYLPTAGCAANVRLQQCKCQVSQASAPAGTPRARVAAAAGRAAAALR